MFLQVKQKTPSAGGAEVQYINITCFPVVKIVDNELRVIIF
jgi:hypothetical protein